MTRGLIMNAGPQNFAAHIQFNLPPHFTDEAMEDQGSSVNYPKLHSRIDSPIICLFH